MEMKGSRSGVAGVAVGSRHRPSECTRSRGERERGRGRRNAEGQKIFFFETPDGRMDGCGLRRTNGVLR